MEMIGKLERDLRDGDFCVSDIAAQQLAAAGTPGCRVLVSVALDDAAATAARIAAVRNLPAAPHAAAFAHLLTDRLPVLRLWALNKVDEAKLVELRDVVASLCDDSAIVRDLCEDICIGDLARRVLGNLRGEDRADRDGGGPQGGSVAEEGAPGFGWLLDERRDSVLVRP
jgi:hypothetical protein